MFFPATDPKRDRRHTSSQIPRSKLNASLKFPSIPKIQHNEDKENCKPKLFKIAKSENLIYNFKRKKPKTSKNFLNKVMY